MKRGGTREMLRERKIKGTIGEIKRERTGWRQKDDGKKDKRDEKTRRKRKTEK